MSFARRCLPLLAMAVACGPAARPAPTVVPAPAAPPAAPAPPPCATAQTLADAVAPLLALDVRAFCGLPTARDDDLRATWGEPAAEVEEQLGYYPAWRFEYLIESASRGIDVWVRDHRVVMVAARVGAAPDAAVLDRLGEPCAILPHEILEQGAYVHEHLYCRRGLLLSVAEPFDKAQPKRIVRVRGIASIAEPRELGPELYMAVEDQVVW